MQSHPTTRRALLTGAAACAVALPASALSAPAPEDPALSAIERHRTAWLAYGRALSHENSIAQSGRPAIRVGKVRLRNLDDIDRYCDADRALERMRRPLYTQFSTKFTAWSNKRERLPAVIAARDEIERWCDETCAAEDALLNMPATTAGGIAAVLAYVGELHGNGEEFGDERWAARLLTNAAAAVRRHDPAQAQA